MLPLNPNLTAHLSNTHVSGVAQIQKLVEGEGESGPAEARGRAVVERPHERQRPGADELRHEDACHQGQAEGQPALCVLGVLQQGPDQERLGTSHKVERQRRDGW